LKFLIIIKQFYNDLKKQKLRTFLTTFGIVWGTVATVFLVAFGEGLYRQTEKAFHGLGDAVVIVWPGQTAKPYKGLPKGRNIRFNDDDIYLLKREIPDITLVSTEYNSNAPMTYNRKTLSQSVNGVYPSFAVIRNVIAEAGGRFINDIDTDYRKRVVFLGTEIRNEVFGENTNPVGKYIMLRGTPFLVIGVMQNKVQNSSYNGRDNRRVFIPATTFKTVFNRQYPNNMVYQIAEPTRWKTVKNNFMKVLGRKYQFDPEDDQALSVWDTNESQAEFKPFFDGLRIFLGIIGIFTLIVGGIGTANIMYVVVKERSKEIGLKMALGATRTYIMVQIISESLFISAIGGTVGFSIAKAFEKIFPIFKLEEYVGNPVVATNAAIITISVIGTIGLLAGYFPARRAAKLNPVEALRL
jgi:putative ABC transport system permease protein